MRKQRVYDDDDGRTIADMTDVGAHPVIAPRFSKRKKEQPEGADSSAPENPISRSERRGFVWGALSAALLIGAVFMIGIALAIVAMLLIWKH